MIAAVPVELGRAEAARLAREELSRQVYRDQQPGWAERLVRWLLRRAADLLDQVVAATPGGPGWLVVLVLLVVAAAVAVRLRVGPLATRAAGDAALFGGRPRSAAEHRAAADAHAARGAWAEAVRERLRAVVRSLEERAVLDERPGRTADEAAAEAGTALPSCAEDLRRAARLFDDVWYGGRPADAGSDAALRDLDRKVRAARPRSVGSRP